MFQIDPSNSLATLAEMAEGFERLQGAADKLQGAFSRMGEGAFAGLQGGLDGIATKFADLDKVVGDFGSLVETSMGVAGLSVEDLIGKVEALGKAFSDAAHASTNMAQSAETAAATANTVPRQGEERSPRRGRGEPQGPPTAEDFVQPFGTGSQYDRAEQENYDRDYRAAQRENSDRNARYDNDRRSAERENREYDERERLRVRDAQPDVNFSDTIEAGGAGYVGGRAGSGGRGHGRTPVGGILHGMAPLIEGAGVYESEKHAMQEDLAIRNTLIEGLHITPEQGQEQFQKAMQDMRQIALDASRGTIYSESRAAEAMPVLARELGFTGQEGMQKFSQIYRPALQAAEVAQQTGLGGLDSSLSASVEYAHMTGAYDPKELEQHLNVLRSIAQLTNQTMHGEESILKYSVPIGMAGGMNADDAAIQTGFLQQQGFNSSTAGTGLSAVILGALNSGGGIGAHLEHTRKQMEHEFANTLHLDPKAAEEQHGGKGSAHTAALAALGITQGGHLTTVDDKGNFDIQKLQEDIRNYARTHSHQEVLNTLHDAFGTRGERVAAIYAEQDSGVRQGRFQEAVRTSPTANQIQTDLSQAPMQQFEQMLANISNIGNTLATPTLSGLNDALKLVNVSLSAFNDFLKNHGDVATGVGYGALAAGTAGALGLGGRVMSVVRRAGSAMLGGGGAAAAEGGLTMGAGEVAAAAGGLPLVGPALLTTLLAQTGYQLGSAAANNLPDDVSGRSAAVAGLNYRATHGGLPAWSAPAAAPTAAPAPSTATAPATGTAQPGPVHIGPVNLTAPTHEDKESWVHEVGSKFTEWLRNSMATSSGNSSGSLSSPFLTGGP